MWINSGLQAPQYYSQKINFGRELDLAVWLVNNKLHLQRVGALTCGLNPHAYMEYTTTNDDITTTV